MGSFGYDYYQIMEQVDVVPITGYAGPPVVPITIVANGNRFTTSPTSNNIDTGATGTNRILVVGVAYDLAAGMSVTGVTYNAVSMTSVGADDHNATGHEYVGLWYLINPATGSNAVAATVAGTITDIYVAGIVFGNVNQTTPVRPGSYVTGGGTAGTSLGGSYSIIVPSNPSDLTVTCVNSGSGSTMISNQTKLDGSAAGTYGMSIDRATNGAASVTHTWSGSGSSKIAIVGFSVQHL